MVQWKVEGIRKLGKAGKVGKMERHRLLRVVTVHFSTAAKQPSVTFLVGLSDAEVVQVQISKDCLK